MEVERLWRHPVGWFYEQDHDTRTRLLAWYQLHTGA